MRAQIEEDKRRQLEISQRSAGGDTMRDKKQWTEEELQMLIKAVNLFPAGTQDRSEKQFTSICEHAHVYVEGWTEARQQFTLGHSMYIGMELLEHCQHWW